MRRALLAFAALAVFAACGDNSPLTVATVQLRSTVSVTCDDGGVDCEVAPRKLGRPHCGYDFTALADAGDVRLDLSFQRELLRGLYEAEVVFQPAAGDASSLGTLRGVMAASDAGTWYSVVSFSPVMRFDTAGNVWGLDLGDAGTGEAVDGGWVVHQPWALSDGGTAVVHESLVATVVEPRTVSVVDHSQDPFYGCCAHVDAATPLAVLGLLTLLRLRRR